ncbi:MAG: energy transducer TonB [Bacteroidales bacterium]|jgi:protein TonB|nr:energy transducer TonB [Bacteroidales bacterium]
MKRFLLLLSAIFLTNIAFCQNEVKVSDDEAIFFVVEVQPEFPGGMDSMYAFIQKNLIYPEKAKAEGIEGRVFITFTIEKDGSVSNVKILRGIGGGCDEAAKEVVEKMPKWKPGTQRGKPVRVQFNLPIKFELEKDKE